MLFGDVWDEVMFSTFFFFLGLRGERRGCSQVTEESNTFRQERPDAAVEGGEKKSAHANKKEKKNTAKSQKKKKKEERTGRVLANLPPGTDGTSFSHPTPTPTHSHTRTQKVLQKKHREKKKYMKKFSLQVPTPRPAAGQMGYQWWSRRLGRLSFPCGRSGKQRRRRKSWR